MKDSTCSVLCMLSTFYVNISQHAHKMISFKFKEISIIMQKCKLMYYVSMMIAIAKMHDNSVQFNFYSQSIM